MKWLGRGISIDRELYDVSGQVSALLQVLAENPEARFSITVPCHEGCEDTTD